MLIIVIVTNYRKLIWIWLCVNTASLGIMKAVLNLIKIKRSSAKSASNG